MIAFYCRFKAYTFSVLIALSANQFVLALVADFPDRIIHVTNSAYHNRIKTRISDVNYLGRPGSLRCVSFAGICIYKRLFDACSL
jgi:hypothetical protein